MKWTIISEMPLLVKNSVLFFSVAFSVGIFLLDIAVFGPDISFTLLYLLPIMATTWFADGKRGIIVAFISILGWSFVKFKHPGYSPDKILFAFDFVSKLGMYLFVVYVLSYLRHTVHSLKASSEKDMLTGVANRTAFHTYLSQELYRSRRTGSPLTLAYIDVDNFKDVNDTHGHQIGDELLILLSDLVRRHIRKTDMIARMGGDEFVLLFPSTGDAAARAVISKIRKGYADLTKNNGWQSSLSIGVATFRKNEYGMEKMIHLADALMYEVKKTAKNGVLFRKY